MKSISINGTKRAAQTKQENIRLRAEGKVPCVLYGGKEQIHFSTPALSLKGLVYTPNVYTVELNIDGASYKAVMKDIQFHAVSDRINHIDFLELDENKKITIEVPVKVSGNAVGVRAGGQLVTKTRRLKVSALPKDLPDSIDVSINELNIGDDIRVRDIKLKGVEILNSPNSVLTAVKITRAVAAAATDEKAAPAAGAAAAAKK
jgi:large subunit ribosomal protein L25